MNDAAVENEGIFIGVCNLVVSICSESCKNITSALKLLILHVLTAEQRRFDTIFSY